MTAVAWTVLLPVATALLLAWHSARRRRAAERLADLEYVLGLVCRVCGCTEERACAGGCSWARPGLCSACADAAVVLETLYDRGQLDLWADVEVDWLFGRSPRVGWPECMACPMARCRDCPRAGDRDMPALELRLEGAS